jgi:hypothetical protein
MPGAFAALLLLGQAEDAGSVVGLLVGVVGAVSGAVGTYLARRYRARSDAALAEQRHLFAQYRGLVAELHGHVALLRGEMETIQKLYADSRVENAALKAYADELERQLARREGEAAHDEGDTPGPAGRAGPGGGAAA